MRLRSSRYRADGELTTPASNSELDPTGPAPVAGAWVAGMFGTLALVLVVLFVFGHVRLPAPGVASRTARAGAIVSRSPAAPLRQRRRKVAGSSRNRLSRL